MTRKLIIRALAESELSEAFDWYEERVPGLGSDFLLHVDAALQSIRRSPEKFPVIYKGLRRALTRRFPYQIFFIVEEHRIIVVAVLHASRHPNHWKKRRSQ